MGRDYIKVKMTLSERFMAFFFGVIPVITASDTPQMVSPMYSESLPIINPSPTVGTRPTEPQPDEALDRLRELEDTTRRNDQRRFFASDDTVKVKSNLGE